MEKLTAEQYFEKKIEVEGRISSLKEEIEKDKGDLAAAETEYKALIFAQDDEKADALFVEKQTLAGRIKSKESRLQTIEAMKEEDLLAYALKVLNYGANHLHEEFAEEVQARAEVVQKAKEDYLSALRALSELNVDHFHKVKPYKEVFKDVGFGDMRFQHKNQIRGMTSAMQKNFFGNTPPLVPMLDYYVKSYANGKYVLVKK